MTLTTQSAFASQIIAAWIKDGSRARCSNLKAEEVQRRACARMLARHATAEDTARLWAACRDDESITDIIRQAADMRAAMAKEAA